MEIGPFKTGKVHLADCLEAMKKMPDNCVTAVITDPPYGLGDGFKDFGKILCSTFFEVVFPDYKKLKAHFFDDGEFSVPASRSSFLAWMDRTVWEESRVGVPEGSIYFNNRVVFWDEKIKDGNVPAEIISDAFLVEKLNAYVFEESPNFFLNLRPCRNASFSDSATCGVTEFGNGRFCVPVVIPLDSCFMAFLDGYFQRESSFSGQIVGLFNDAFSEPDASSFVMTSTGAELRAMFSFDLRRGTVKFLPAISTDKFDFVFELRCTKPVGTQPRAGSLPSMFESIQVRVVGGFANRTFSLCLHKSIVSLIKKKYSGFMGKKWDHGVPGVAFWEEALRICKPGAPMFAFGGTRTHHRLMVAIEDAGWEIRDVLSWNYGSGFPKSLDISKAIDKAADAERDVVGVRHKRTANEKYGGGKGTNLETLETLPATPEAKKWDGWGTALKPAWEPIVWAMKPCEGTFAENAVEHGVAGVCIDGARISGVVPKTTQGKSDSKYGGGKGFAPEGLQESNPSPLGRWPANVILQHHPECVLKGTKNVKGSNFGGHPEGRKNQVFGTDKRAREAAGYCGEDGLEEVEDWECHPDCPVRLMDEQSGLLTSGKPVGKRGGTSGQSGIYGSDGCRAGSDLAGFGDSGGASRFFKCCNGEKTCALCNLPLVRKHDTMSKEDGGVSCNESSAESAVRSSRIIRAIIEDFVPQTVPGNLVERIARNVPYVESLCDSCVTGIAAVLVEIKTLGSSRETLRAILGSIGNYKSSILIQNLVSFAGLWESTDTIPTTESLSILCGSVLHAIGNCTRQDESVQKGNILSGKTRFMYAPKASKSERGPGNNHPTVKPLEVMKWLVGLVRMPEENLILDPFAGSGTTGFACEILKIPFIGFELDEKWVKVSNRRIRSVTYGDVSVKEYEAGQRGLFEDVDDE